MVKLLNESIDHCKNIKIKLQQIPIIKTKLENHINKKMDLYKQHIIFQGKKFVKMILDDVEGNIINLDSLCYINNTINTEENHSVLKNKLIQKINFYKNIKNINVNYIYLNMDETNNLLSVLHTSDTTTSESTIHNALNKILQLNLIKSKLSIGLLEKIRNHFIKKNKSDPIIY